jgi:hypothetical protein
MLWVHTYSFTKAATGSKRTHVTDAVVTCILQYSPLLLLLYLQHCSFDCYTALHHITLPNNVTHTHTLTLTQKLAAASTAVLPLGLIQYTLYSMQQ